MNSDANGYHDTPPVTDYPQICIGSPHSDANIE